ncbi:MAG TPA: T9SS type A sorting domain-containing protein [Puia sp.]|nr:T9SS type A sorting domain-containing protein [Puia sp.]
MNSVTNTNTVKKTKKNVKNTILPILTAFALVSAATATAQSSHDLHEANTAKITYNVSSNSNWSDAIPVNCTNCIINISKGMLLTVDKAVSIQNCAFQGGTVAVKDLTIQFAGGKNVYTTFNGTNLLVAGNNGALIANSAISVTGSTFIFNDASSFKTNYQIDLSASRINVYDNANMLSTGSDGSSINLSNSSQIVIGSGIRTSTASFAVSGSAFNINVYDNSSIVLGNQNNAYSNSSKYNAASSLTSAMNSFATAGSRMNCGSGYVNSCSSLALYGPAILSTTGIAAGVSIPVVLVGFSATLNNDRTIGLDWNTKQEVNSGHFEIEHSQDGSVWNEIGTVKAKVNSATASDYVFTDQNPIVGMNYYRLKLVNLDGSFGYTDVKVVRTTMVTNISFFPNPAIDYVNVSLGASAGSETTIRLLNQAGQVLQEKKVAAGSATIVSFPVQQYHTGFYILSVASANGSHETSKLLINRS